MFLKARLARALTLLSLGLLLPLSAAVANPCTYDLVPFYVIKSYPNLLCPKCDPIVKTLWGYKKQDTGAVQIPAKFEEARGAFCNGLAAVKKEGHWGFVDKVGRQVIPTDYDSVKDFYYGFAAVRTNGEWTLVDKKNKTCGKNYYDLDGSSNGTFRAKELDDEGLVKSGLISTKCETMVKSEHEDIKAVGKDWAAVYAKGRWGVITTSGKPVLATKYRGIEPLSWTENVVKVLSTIEDETRMQIYSEKRGFAIKGMYFKSANFMYEGKVATCTKEGCNFLVVDNDGWLSSKPYTETTGYFTNAFAGFRVDKKWGYLDDKGTEVIPAQWNSVSPFDKDDEGKRTARVTYYSQKFYKNSSYFQTCVSNAVLIDEQGTKLKSLGEWDIGIKRDDCY